MYDKLKITLQVSNSSIYPAFNKTTHQ